MPAIWRRVAEDHYATDFYRGHYEIVKIEGAWTLWFTAPLTRGLIRQAGSWTHLDGAKRRAKVLDNDYYLYRSMSL